MSNRPGRSGNGGGTLASGCAIGGCALAASAIGLVLLFLVIIAGAATAMVDDPVGSVIGWLTGDGPPDPNHRPSKNAPRGMELRTVTPRPADCGVTPTPVVYTVTADPNQPTPVPPDTAAPPASIALPTATPCPTPYSHLNTPDPRWTPIPGGAGPAGWPLRGAGGGNITQNFGCTDYAYEPVDDSCTPILRGHWPLPLGARHL